MQHSAFWILVDVIFQVPNYFITEGKEQSSKDFVLNFRASQVQLKVINYFAATCSSIEKDNIRRKIKQRVIVYYYFYSLKC